AGDAGPRDAVPPCPARAGAARRRGDARGVFLVAEGKAGARPDRGAEARGGIAPPPAMAGPGGVRGGEGDGRPRRLAAREVGSVAAGTAPPRARPGAPGRSGGGGRGRAPLPLGAGRAGDGGGGHGVSPAKTSARSGATASVTGVPGSSRRRSRKIISMPSPA